MCQGVKNCGCQHHPVFIGQQNFPNFQRQIAGPAAGVGLGVSRASQRARPRITASMPLTNRMQTGIHTFSYRDDPSGAGPGGPEVNTPPKTSSFVAKLKARLIPAPNTVRLPHTEAWFWVLPSVLPKESAP